MTISSQTLTKAEMAESLAVKLGVSKKKGISLVKTFFETISENLESGKEVKVSGFGNFSLRDKASRPGRNPMTNEFSVIKARRVVTFKPGTKLKSRIKLSD